MSPTDDMRSAENSDLAKPTPLTFVLSPRREGRGEGEGWLSFRRIAHAFREPAS
jgi:hypothetical protein